tara:strand:+ start:216625 stop:216921 length:297 start_codon:yes stop_codon:yes gene_type:complete
MRRYEKNDWWDFVTVIEQELERDNGYKTYFNIADELKWRIVESISEGGNHKIRKKVQEVKDRFEKDRLDYEVLSEAQLNDIYVLFDFVLKAKNSHLQE